jgi:hypothetical protein
MSLLDLLHENVVADNDLLLKNDAMGDIFTKPREVYFAFKTTDRTALKYLCEFIKGKNFGNPRHITEGGDGLFWLEVVVSMPITQNLVCSVSGFMLCLSRLFKVEYDGWGSVVQNETPSPSA